MFTIFGSNFIRDDKSYNGHMLMLFLLSTDTKENWYTILTTGAIYLGIIFFLSFNSDEKKINNKFVWSDLFFL